MIIQDVPNVIMDMIFKMKNVICILMVVVHIILQAIVKIVKVDMNCKVIYVILQ